MTKEEAIKWLNRIEDKYIHGGDDDFDAKRKQALGMAIEALKADRPKRKWNWMADCGVTECDQCGWSIAEYVGDYNFCPNCGSDNRERREE